MSALESEGQIGGVKTTTQSFSCPLILGFEIKMIMEQQAPLSPILLDRILRCLLAERINSDPLIHWLPI